MTYVDGCNKRTAGPASLPLPTSSNTEMGNQPSPLPSTLAPTTTPRSRRAPAGSPTRSKRALRTPRKRMARLRSKGSVRSQGSARSSRRRRGRSRRKSPRRKLKATRSAASPIHTATPTTDANAEPDGSVPGDGPSTRDAPTPGVEGKQEESRLRSHMSSKTMGLWRHVRATAKVTSMALQQKRKRAARFSTALAPVAQLTSVGDGISPYGAAIRRCAYVRAPGCCRCYCCCCCYWW